MTHSYRISTAVCTGYDIEQVMVAIKLALDDSGVVLVIVHVGHGKFSR